MLLNIIYSLTIFLSCVVYTYTYTYWHLYINCCFLFSRTECVKCMFDREDLSDTLRILVATDCHLGYMEKDEIRRHDSFKAFEEICSIAEDKQVFIFILSVATIFIFSSFFFSLFQTGGLLTPWR